MSSKLDTLVLDRLRIAYRAPAVLATGVIFTIVGGPVWIQGFCMYSAAAQGGGPTITVTCNGLAWDNGAFNYSTGGLAGTFWVWSLVGGAGPVPLNAVMEPMPTLAELPLNLGVLASHNAANNTIAMAIAGANANPWSFHCVYYAMSPASQLV
jgi:hypothetical protein